MLLLRCICKWYAILLHNIEDDLQLREYACALCINNACARSINKAEYNITKARSEIYEWFDKKVYKYLNVEINILAEISTLLRPC